MPHDTINMHAVLPDLFPRNEQKGLITRLYNRLVYMFSFERCPKCEHRDLIVWNWPESLELPARQLDGYETTRDHIHEYVDKLCQHTRCLYHLCLPHSE